MGVDAAKLATRRCQQDQHPLLAQRLQFGDSQYGHDLDATMVYARRAGLRYVEVRETSLESF